jgi:hypothetical protein
MFQRHAVEVAAVFCGVAGNERRFPQRFEAVTIADCRDAVEQRVDEDRLAILAKSDVMDIEVACHPALMRSKRRVHAIGIVRATVKIGMQNLAYNMRRLVVLERIAVATG